MLVYNSSLPISLRIKQNPYHGLQGLMWSALTPISVPNLVSNNLPSCSSFPAHHPLCNSFCSEGHPYLRAFVLAIPCVWNVLSQWTTVQFISSFSSLLNITSEKSVILPKIFLLLPHHSLFSSPAHSRC